MSLVKHLKFTQVIKMWHDKNVAAQLIAPITGLTEGLAQSIAPPQQLQAPTSHFTTSTGQRAFSIREWLILPPFLFTLISVILANNKVNLMNHFFKIRKLTYTLAYNTILRGANGDDVGKESEFVQSHPYEREDLWGKVRQVIIIYLCPLQYRLRTPP